MTQDRETAMGHPRMVLTLQRRQTTSTPHRMCMKPLQRSLPKIIHLITLFLFVSYRPAVAFFPSQEIAPALRHQLEQIADSLQNYDMPDGCQVLLKRCTR